MDDDPEESSTPTRAKPSTIPSWVMLGFVLGATFVWLLPRRDRAEAPPPAREPVQPAIIPRQPPRLMIAEGLFERGIQFAKWENDATEIAVWSTETSDYTDYFEVRRLRSTSGPGYDYFFRTIPGLTRPVIDRGIPEDSLVRFTESLAENQRRRDEILGNSVRRLLVGPPRSPPAGAAPTVPVDPAPVVIDPPSTVPPVK